VSLGAATFHLESTHTLHRFDLELMAMPSHTEAGVLYRVPGIIEMIFMK